MASEQEELRLTVSLVDNASAGIASLRTQIQGLSTGPTAQSFETFRRNQRAMGEQIKEITAAAIGGERAMLGYIGKFGVLGLAVSAGVGFLKQYAEGLEGINRVAASLGTSGTHIKNIVDQLKAVGVADQDALKEVNKFVERSNELLRENSAARQEFMRHATNPEAAQRLLQTIELAQTAEERINLAYAAANRVAEERRKLDEDLGKSRETANEDARAARREYLEFFGLNEDFANRVGNSFKAMTAAQEQANREILKRGEEITRMWNAIGAAGTEAKDKVVLAWGPTMVTMLGQVPGAIDAIGTAFGKIPAILDQINEQGKPVSDFLNKLSGIGGKASVPPLGELPGVPKVGPGGILPGTAPGDNPPWFTGFPGATRDRRSIVGPGRGFAGPTGPGSLRLHPDLSRELGIDSIPLGGATGGFGGVQPFGGFGGAPLSTNIEDRRNEGRALADNTKELKELNDNLFALLHPAEGGGVGPMRGLGGLPGMGGGAGGGGSGGGGGAGGAGTPPGGTAPIGAGGGGGGLKFPISSGEGPESIAEAQRKGYLPGAGGGGGGDFGKIADAIQHQEGWRPGTISHDQNNPGNLKWGPFAKAHGATGPGRGGHAIFPSYEAGRGALIDLLKTKGKDQSIAQIGKWWAQDPNWAAGVARAAHVDPSFVPKTETTAGGGGRGHITIADIAGLRGSVPGGAGTGIPGDVLHQAAALVASGANTQQLKQWMKEQGYPQHDNWCGDFVASVETARGFKRSDLPGNPAWAADWHKWGQHAEVPQAGDVGSRWAQIRGHGHVVEVEGYDPKTQTVTVIQGNPAARYTMPLKAFNAKYDLRHMDLPKDAREAAAAGPRADSDRKTLDEQATQTHRVEGTGTLTANINAPKGTDVNVEGGGIFKKVEVNRQVQMSRARQGPVAPSNQM